MLHHPNAPLLRCVAFFTMQDFYMPGRLAYNRPVQFNQDISRG
jgi:hypothetical protein